MEKLPSLQVKLDEKKNAFNEKASDDKKELYARGIQAIVDDKIIQMAVRVGTKAPDFTLSNSKSEDIRLYDLLSNGPVILTWYRGGWCPYCNITLAHLQESLPEFKKRGAQLIALTPELPDKSLTTSEKNNLEFEVLSDVGNVVAKSYGVVFKMIPELAEAYSKFGLEDYNGDDSAELPLAATYVIDQEGMVQFAFLDADYRNRAEPSAILAALDGLSSSIGK